MCERENSSHAGLRTFLAAIVITISVSVVHSATDTPASAATAPSAMPRTALPVPSAMLSVVPQAP